MCVVRGGGGEGVVGGAVGALRDSISGLRANDLLRCTGRFSNFSFFCRSRSTAQSTSVSSACCVVKLIKFRLDLAGSYTATAVMAAVPKESHSGIHVLSFL